MKFMQWLWGLMLLLLGTMTAGADQLNFLSRPLLAGKASLTENGFVESATLGTANFSPELRLPIQLVYRSNSEKSGMFGFGWSSPQLESSAGYDRDGALWTTPWGEKIKFYPKDAKPAPNAIKVELYEAQKKGRGFYAPYSDWEAVTATAKDRLQDCKDWTFSGKRRYAGWKFVYREGKLRSITAPSDRTLTFVYNRDRVEKIIQNNVPLLEVATDKSGQAEMIRISGTEHRFSYSPGRVTLMPKTVEGVPVHGDRRRLASWRTGDLQPVTFGYDDAGYLTRRKQGAHEEKWVVQHETAAQRRANLLSKDRKNNVTHSGAVAGRLLKDGEFEYDYNAVTPGKVTLTDRARRKAVYDYDAMTGIFKSCDFAGKSQTVYYFMRYDVAYLGKVRKIVDGRGRDVVNYRYDRLTGNVVRTRDMAGNDTDFSYDAAGRLIAISRRAATQEKPEPVMSQAYDREGNLAAISQLDANGRAVTTTRIEYDRNRAARWISDGRGAKQMARNDFGYAVRLEDAFGGVTSIRYDRYNRPEEVKNKFGVVTQIAYTPSGLIASMRRLTGGELRSSLEITYDDCGKPVCYRDQSGREKRFERNEFNQVAKELFPDGTSIGYAYDAAGRLNRVEDQNGHAIRFDWTKYGIDRKFTAEGQVTDYEYDAHGMLTRVDSKIKSKTDRSIQYTYNALDKLATEDYGNGEIVRYEYDQWGKVSKMTRGNHSAEYRYDYWGRMVWKRDGAVETSYAYNPWGQRTERVTQNGSLTLRETREYDKLGRLAAIQSGDRSVKFLYNRQSQLATQLVNGLPIDFTYTPDGRLAGKYLGGKANPVGTLEYVYAKDGTILMRKLDGKLQHYRYDARGQLLAVVNSDGTAAEQYVYDPAGNILKKTVAGKTTVFSYDRANQLKSSSQDGVTTTYEYDAAGRLVREGGKQYRYGYLDRILEVSENGERVAAFDYHADGQVSKATYGDKSEDFLWDGLAMIRRGGTEYTNEPAITGGNPVLANDKVMFNDMLGSTLGVKDGEKYDKVSMTAFGETADRDALFTGKPLIGELGYAFLFRNYRPDTGKWQTQDPIAFTHATVDPTINRDLFASLGYPDGWNNLAYCSNNVIDSIDFQGTVWILVDDDGIPVVEDVVTVKKCEIPPWIDAGLSNGVGRVTTTTKTKYKRNSSTDSLNQDIIPQIGDIRVITITYDIEQEIKQLSEANKNGTWTAIGGTNLTTKIVGTYIRTLTYIWE